MFRFIAKIKKRRDLLPLFLQGDDFMGTPIRSNNYGTGKTIDNTVRTRKVSPEELEAELKRFDGKLHNGVEKKPALFDTANQYKWDSIKNRQHNAMRERGKCK